MCGTLWQFFGGVYCGLCTWMQMPEKRASRALERKLQVVASHCAWVLELNLGPLKKKKALLALNHWAVSPTPVKCFFMQYILRFTSPLHRIYLVLECKDVSVLKTDCCSLSHKHKNDQLNRHTNISQPKFCPDRSTRWPNLEGNYLNRTEASHGKPIGSVFAEPEGLRTQQRCL